MPPPPSAGRPEPGLFRGVRSSDLTLGTAIEVAFRALANAAFVVPILVLAVLISAVTELLLGPTVARWQDISSARPPSADEVNQLLNGLAVSLPISLVGGILVAVYGTIWAVAASAGPPPGLRETLDLVGRRWGRVLGASILIGAITFAAILAGIVVVAILGQVSAAIAFGVTVGLFVALVWLLARLSMTTWLAADGGGVTASLRESFRITEGAVLRIIGWTLTYGFLFALLTAAAGVVLGRIPYVGQGLATGLSLALSYGAGVTLFRRTQAGAPPAGPAAAAPTVHGGPVG